MRRTKVRPVVAVVQDAINAIERGDALEADKARLLLTAALSDPYRQCERARRVHRLRNRVLASAIELGTSLAALDELCNMARGET